MVKQAMSFKDCSIEDLEEGVQEEYVTQDQYKEITGEAYKETSEA